MKAALGIVLGLCAVGCGANVVFGEDGDGDGGGGGGSSQQSRYDRACNTFCEDLSVCSPVGECSTFCDEQAANNVTLGCLEQFTAFIECASTDLDICNPDQLGCTSELTSYGICISSACLDDPSNPACTGGF